MKCSHHPPRKCELIDIFDRITLQWHDKQFIQSNLTSKEANMCYPGIVRQEQVDELWKPDIYIDGTMDKVNRTILPDKLNFEINPPRI